MNKQSPFGILRNGVFDENPVLRMVLGCCPTLAITTSATNGLGMGLSTAAVMVGSNFAISALRNVIPEKVRIPSYIVIIAGFVTVIQYLLKAYVPELDKALGIYIPLIVANCILLARAEMFAAKNTPLPSLIDGLAMGLGFTLALVMIGGVREITGAAALFGVPVFALLGSVLPEGVVAALKAASVSPMVIMILPPGGFVAFGLVIVLMNKFMRSVMKVTHEAKNPHAV